MLELKSLKKGNPIQALEFLQFDKKNTKILNKSSSYLYKLGSDIINGGYDK